MSSYIRALPAVNGGKEYGFVAFGVCRVIHNVNDAANAEGVPLRQITLLESSQLSRSLSPPLQDTSTVFF